MNISLDENTGASPLHAARTAIQSKRQFETRIAERQNALKPLAALMAAFVVCTLQIYAQAEHFSYAINAGAVSIIKYTGPGGEVRIPGSIAGLPVAHFGTAFAQRSDLTNVTIPESVTEIGTYAFADCTGLKSVVIGGNIATIKAGAFARCVQLTAVYLTGSFPNAEPTAFSSEFTSYYLPGIPVFGGNWAGRPTAPWLPRIESAVPGTGTNDFGFTITWTGGQSLLVESCTNLTNPIWVRQQLSTLTNESIRFEDQNWTKHPVQFYRLVAVDLPTDVIPVTNMVFISPGEFTMGSPITEAGRWDDEGPQTPVTISRGFWMGRYEVTQAEYLEVIGINPSFHNGLKNGTNYGTDLSRPVEQVRWGDAVAFCDALTAREQAAGRLHAGYAYRLPTEAEWEYSCRAGTTTPFYLGDDLRSGMANFNGRFEYPPCGDSLTFCTNAFGISLGRTVSVGSYGPNPWGLHDMIGNVGEWCHDWFSDNYSGVPEIDPLGPATGVRRTGRGGSWRHPATALRSALRDYGGMEYKGDFTGFRVVLAPIP